MCRCPVFPAPLIEETVFSPLYVLASFVKDKVPTGAWVYLWAFHPLPLVCISVFVPVLCCLMTLALQTKVRKVDPSSSILLFQDCFGSQYILDVSAIKEQLVDKSRQHMEKQRHHFAHKSPYSQSDSFSNCHVWM